MSDQGRRVVLLATADGLPAEGTAPSGVTPAALVELSEVMRADEKAARATTDAPGSGTTAAMARVV